MPSPQYQALEQRLAAHDKRAASEMLALAANGDADALFKAAELSLRGMAGPVDLAAAYRFMSEAAAKGRGEARRGEAYFTAAGFGTEADPARARSMLERLAAEDRFVAVQLAFLAHMTCGERVKSAPRQLV